MIEAKDSMDDRPDTAASSTPPPTIAAVEIHGRVIRYGELVRAENDGPGILRKLGTCDFEFSATEAVFGDVAPRDFDTVVEAVAEIFKGSNAHVLRVAAHPPVLTGFFTPLPEGMAASDRHEQLRQEAALLADVSASQPVRIRAVPIRTEDVAVAERPEPHRWHHVLHVPEPVHARIMLMARALNMGTYDLLDTTRVAARVVTVLDEMAPIPPMAGQSDSPYTLALGAYDDHVELSIVYDGAWFHGHHGLVGAPDDAAYFAAALLDRIGLGTSDIGRFLLYGENAEPADFRLLTDLLGQQPTLVDPLALFGRAPAGASPALLASYVPCVGALLT